VHPWFAHGSPAWDNAEQQLNEERGPMATSQDSPMRAGVIGLGGMGQRHAEAYERTDGVELVAACEVKEEVAAEFRGKRQRVRVYADAGEMLAREKLDVLSIAAHTPVFEDCVLAAVAAGVGRILCEKPMAHSLGAARRMIDACATQQVRLAVNHTRRFDAKHRQLRDLIADGVIGQVSAIISTMRGALFACMATHMFDLARMLTGCEFVSVVGGISPAPHRPNRRGEQYYDPGAHCFAYMDGGVRVYIDHSEDLGTPPRFEALGTMGWVTIEQGRGLWRLEARKAEDRSKPVWDTSVALEEVEFPKGARPGPGPLGAAIEELLGDGPIASQGSDGYAALEAVVATHLSHERGGERVSLPLDGEDVERIFAFT